MGAPRYPHITISKDGEPDRIIVAKSNDDDIAALIGKIETLRYQYRETHEWLLERVAQINNLQATYDGTKDNLNMSEYENVQLKAELAKRDKVIEAAKEVYKAWKNLADDSWLKFPLEFDMVIDDLLRPALHELEEPK